MAPGPALSPQPAPGQAANPPYPVVGRGRRQFDQAIDTTLLPPLMIHSKSGYIRTYSTYEYYTPRISMKKPNTQFSIFSFSQISVTIKLHEYSTVPVPTVQVLVF